MDQRQSRFVRSLFAGCATLIAAISTEAVAQPQDGAETALGEVVVTAQRRTERLVDVPMSVTALASEQMEKAGVVSIHDLGRIAPGTQINFAGCCTQPTIRGITTLTTGVGFENNVAIYIDGFYSPDNVTVNGDLANISSIEVLKGPQGTLYGRNATGGAILINTKAPSRELTGRIEGTYGRFNDWSISGYVSGPVSDRLRYSLAAYYRESDGYNKLLDTTGRKVGDVTPLKQISVRSKLEFDVTDDLTATLSYNMGLAKDPRGNLFTVFQYAPASLPRPPVRTESPFSSTTNRKTDVLGITDEGTLKLAYKTSIGTLTSYTGYAHRRTKLAFDFDGSYLDIVGSDQRWMQDTWQQGIDFNITAIDGVDLVIGGTYYQDRFKNLGQRGYANFALTSTYTATLVAEAWAGYVDATVKLTDALSLNVGARYTSEEKTARYRTVGPTGNLLAPPGENDVKFHAFTPRASLRYKLGERTNVYASYSRGFRSGGFQPNGATLPALFIPFRPEKITAYEVGFKTANSWLRFDTAAFYYDYKDLQVGVTVPNPVVPGGLINLVSNAPKAEVYGIDAEITAQPIDRLNIHAGVAILHARYRNFANATGNGFNIATGLNVTGQVQDWSDIQMARSPKLSGSLGVDYEIVDVAGGALTLAANASYTAGHVLSNPSIYGPLAGGLARKQRYRQSGYTLVNVQATWRDADERYKVGVFVNNLTDKRYRMTYNGGAFGDYSSWASPRTYGVRLGYNF